MKAVQFLFAVLVCGVAIAQEKEFRIESIQDNEGERMLSHKSTKAPSIKSSSKAPSIKSIKSSKAPSTKATKAPVVRKRDRRRVMVAQEKEFRIESTDEAVSHPCVFCDDVR
jgi:hypothetical protein